MPRSLHPLRLYYFTSFAALGAYAPFFPRWLESRGVHGLAMGAVCALMPALGVLGPPAVGLVADALGLRGSILRVACLGASLSIGALGVASGAYPALPLSLIFAAVFFYAAFRSPMVMLADVVTLERARAAGTTYGKVRLWGSIGFLVAAIATPRVIDPRAPVALPATIAAGLFVAFLAAWTLPAKPSARPLPVVREARALLAAADFTTFLAVTLLGQIAHTAHDLCLSLHLRDLGASDGTAGVAWGIGVAFEIALMALVEPLMTRFTPKPLVAFALLGAAVRWALIGSLGSVPLLLAAQPLHAISFALWWVASLAYLKERAPAHAAATAQGLFSAAGAMGSVTGMLVWGTVYRRAGGGVVFGAAAGIALVAAMVAARWARAHGGDRGYRIRER